jgi:hypothetical protein
MNTKIKNGELRKKCVRNPRESLGLSSELEENISIFIVYVFGIVMILVGHQFSILTGWLFWFPLGMLTLPCAKYAILIIENIYSKKQKKQLHKSR